MNKKRILRTVLALTLCSFGLTACAGMHRIQERLEEIPETLEETPDTLEEIPDTMESIPGGGAGTAGRGEESHADEAGNRSLIDAKSSIFQSIELNKDDMISSDFEVYLAETDAVFLVVEASEDTEAVMHYTYGSQDKGGIKLAYYSDVEEEPVVYELKAATDHVYGNFWTDEKFMLYKGKNVFYLSGDDVTCRMRFEIRDFEEDKIRDVRLTLEGSSDSGQ